jgi:hypothetical protein
MKTGTLDLLRQQTTPLFWRTDFQKLLLFLFLALISFLVVTPLLILLYGSFQSANPAGTSTFSVTVGRKRSSRIAAGSKFCSGCRISFPRWPIALDWILRLDRQYGGQQRAADVA